MEIIINVIVVGIMICLFGLSWIKISNNPKGQIVLPGIIAAIGIIGTFLGIFLGLLNFDPNKLEASVPSLINGMRTAFLTSLVGLILSNILKGFKAFKVNKLNKESGVSEEDVSLKEIVFLMKEMNHSTIESNKVMVFNIQKMTKSLVGDGETSLTNQMNMLRVDLIDTQKQAQERLNEGLNQMTIQLDSLVKSNNSISDEIEKGNKELITEFRSFAKDMAENNMKAFIDAIERSIKDLNTQLKEQFGENFKQLNLAVENLLDWQVHYKETVEQTNENQKKLYRGMFEAKNLVNEIMENTKPIVEVANRLGDKIITFDTQEKTLNNSIEVLNNISEKAVLLLPKLDETRNEILELTKTSTSNIENQKNKIVSAINQITNGIKNSSDLNRMSIEKQISTMEKAVTRLENEGFTITKKVSDNIQVMVENNNKNLETSVNNLNSQLGVSLNKSLESLGNQLASVSEKFVADYIPLTMELQKVVEIAKRVR